MPAIALTFDDGPNTVTTPQVLNLLEKEGITATFFLIAQNITPESAAVVRRARKMGCEIENHSVTHAQMDKMSADEIRREVGDCTEKIREVLGEEPIFFRPPYIAVSQTLYDTVELGMICGVGCEDWVPEVTAEQRVTRVLDSAEDGQIVLLHDSEGNQNTVEALKTMIPELKRRGYKFLTVSELFKEKNTVARHGWLYSNVLQENADNHL